MSNKEGPVLIPELLGLKSRVSQRGIGTEIARKEIHVMP